MGMGAYLVPLHRVARAVAAEHGVRRVVHVPLRVVAHCLHHRRLVSAGAVARRSTQQPPPAPGVGRHLGGVAPEGCHRGGAGEDGLLTKGLRRGGLAVHPLEVAHGPAHLLGGQLQPEVVPRLQQHALGLHQALPHRPVGGLAEVAALGVLHMGPARHQGDFHIRDGSAGQNAQMGLFRQMGQNQPLPVQIQLVGGTVGGQNQAAAPGSGLQEEMHFSIVAQGFEMADALHGVCDGFPVADGALSEIHLHIEPLPQAAAQDLHLHLAHELDMDFP